MWPVLDVSHVMDNTGKVFFFINFECVELNNDVYVLIIILQLRIS